MFNKKKNIKLEENKEDRLFSKQLDNIAASSSLINNYLFKIMEFDDIIKVLPNSSYKDELEKQLTDTKNRLVNAMTDYDNDRDNLMEWLGKNKDKLNYFKDSCYVLTPYNNAIDELKEYYRYLTKE